MVNMAMAEDAVKSLWQDEMTIYEKKKVNKPNGAKGFKNEPVIERAPCKLSFSSLASTTQGDVASIVQTIKLLCDKNVEVKPGSVIEVLHQGSACYFKHSGKPAIYSVHQELMLEPYEEYA